MSLVIWMIVNNEEVGMRKETVLSYFEVLQDWGEQWRLLIKETDSQAGIEPGTSKAGSVNADHSLHHNI
jgi:hypothetical protein